MKIFKRLYCLFIIKVVNNLLSGPRPSTFGLKRMLLRSIGYQIGFDSKIVGPVINTGNLIVGRNCWVGANLTIHGNGTVIIADNCDIGPDVTFLTGGHAIGDPLRRAGKGQTYTIHVEDGCWIGARSTILGNTTIGKSCVVAACACVTKNMKSNQLMGGVNAKTIRKLENEFVETN